VDDADFEATFHIFAVVAEQLVEVLQCPIKVPLTHEQVTQAGMGLNVVAVEGEEAQVDFLGRFGAVGCFIEIGQIEQGMLE